MAERRVVSFVTFSVSCGHQSDHFWWISALAVALMIASEVIVALLVVSTPFTLCLAMTLAVVSVSAE